MGEIELGWYFSNVECTLGYKDGRKIEAGIAHEVDCVPVLCKIGLHACKSITQALVYAPGSHIWRVELSGNIVYDDDDGNEMVATERSYLWGFDASNALRDFARHCVADVGDLLDSPITVVQQLQTGGESARALGWAAAWAASWASVWDDDWEAPDGWEYAWQVALADGREYAKDYPSDNVRAVARDKYNWLLMNKIMSER